MLPSEKPLPWGKITAVSPFCRGSSSKSRGVHLSLSEKTLETSLGENNKVPRAPLLCYKRSTSAWSHQAVDVADFGLTAFVTPKLGLPPYHHIVSLNASFDPVSMASTMCWPGMIKLAQMTVALT